MSQGVVVQCDLGAYLHGRVFSLMHMKQVGSVPWPCANTRLRRLGKQLAYQKKEENTKSHSCSRAVNHAWLFVSLSLQVCRCSLSSPKGSRRGVLAAIARLKTATCSRPWTNTGTKTVSNVPAATAAWGRWAPPCTRKPTSSSVAGTTWGKKDTQSLFSTHKNTKGRVITRLCDIFQSFKASELWSPFRKKWYW